MAGNGGGSGRGEPGERCPCDTDTPGKTLLGNQHRHSTRTTRRCRVAGSRWDFPDGAGKSPGTLTRAVEGTGGQEGAHPGVSWTTSGKGSGRRRDWTGRWQAGVGQWLRQAGERVLDEHWRWDHDAGEEGKVFRQSGKLRGGQAGRAVLIRVVVLRLCDGPAQAAGVSAVEGLLHTGGEAALCRIVHKHACPGGTLQQAERSAAEVQADAEEAKELEEAVQ